MSPAARRETIGVRVGGVAIGGGAPVVIQSMTNTDTTNVVATARQIRNLAGAGSELVRITVNTLEAAQCTAEIVRRVREAGCTAPIIGDFHYNGHKLLTEVPECARALDKYRINPGNVGVGKNRDAHFATICRVAVEEDKAIRIGVNVGSLHPELVEQQMCENAERDLGRTPEEVLNECMILSVLQSTELALECGLHRNQIVVSCKSSTPRHLIDLHRELAHRIQQPIHLGLTEAGIGLRGVVWSSVAMGVLLDEGIGDTIRVSLTPRPGGDRCEEVYMACELLQALGLRRFAPTVTACPGCGRTSGTDYQRLAEDITDYVHAKMPEWRERFDGVEDLAIAVMGCIVNGPGESKAAHIGISLPGADESPSCPVYIDGIRAASLSGTPEELAAAFRNIIENYIQTKCAHRNTCP